MSFWLAAGLMILGAVLMVVVPLLRGGVQGGRAERNAAVRSLYHQRLDELDVDVASGHLSAASRDEVAEELGAALLGDFEQATPGRRGDARPVSSAVALALALVLPLVVVFVYLEVGDPGADQVSGADALLGMDPRSQRADIAAWRDRLDARVSRRPNDASSWYLLGLANLQLGGFSRAAEAFAMSHALTGENPVVDAYWLQARYLSSGGRIDQETRAIGDRLLQSQPNQPLVLEIYAVDAYRRGDYQEAVALFSRALAGNLESEQRAVLAGGLQEARARLGDLVPSLDVSVSTDGDSPDGWTLFVIARPPGGGMPFAVVRRPAASLPLDVRLDDAVAMNAGRPLSEAGEVELVVRLSRSGAPGAQAGDWEWRSELVDLSELTAPRRVEAVLRKPDPS
ncbi:MAG: c-type cytochrome biogenesis protein CcmI [Pseudomonadales bacterium]|nr:c-type cytochrome biogenesis protein CcmI [Pseudomonadales bacterium]NIX08452.1 c-type cytochrome biogenesis protein CcmI [Pseudomonadales bacterium]